MTKPRLLFVAPWFLFPRNTGGRIRTSDILRGLKDGAFDVTLVSPNPDDDGDYEHEIDGVCDRFVGWPPQKHGPLFEYARLRYLLSALPVSVATDRWPPAQQTIAAELGKGFDVAVVDFPHTSVLAPTHIEAPTVMFTHNVESEIFRRHADVAGNPVTRAIWRNQYAKMTRFEGEVLRRFDEIVAVSDRDRQFFEQHYGLSNISVIPTGVDLDYFARRSPTDEARAERAQADTIVFTGSMDWMPNIDGIEFFMDDVWPRVAVQRPDAKVVVVGRQPPQRLVDQAARRDLPWTFTGFVDDVRPYVHDADVYIIPLRVGGGTRLKVFEAMAMGSPIVSTAIGIEGLPVENERHFILADKADAFADAVLRLLGDPAERSRLADAARRYVEQNASSKVAAQAFESVCLRAAGAGT